MIFFLIAVLYYPREEEMATQYSCLENLMDRGAWQATIHGISESDTNEVTYHVLF